MPCPLPMPYKSLRASVHWATPHATGLCTTRKQLIVVLLIKKTSSVYIKRSHSYAPSEVKGQKVLVMFGHILTLSQFPLLLSCTHMNLWPIWRVGQALAVGRATVTLHPHTQAANSHPRSCPHSTQGSMNKHHYSVNAFVASPPDSPEANEGIRQGLQVNWVPLD